MPTEALELKANQYVDKDMISAEMANRVIQAIVQERGHASILNDDELLSFLFLDILPQMILHTPEIILHTYSSCLRKAAGPLHL